MRPKCPPQLLLHPSSEPEPAVCRNWHDERKDTEKPTLSVFIPGASESESSLGWLPVSERWRQTFSSFADKTSTGKQQGTLQAVNLHAL